MILRVRHRQADSLQLFFVKGEQNSAELVVGVGLEQKPDFVLRKEVLGGFYGGRGTAFAERRLCDVEISFKQFY